MSAKKIAFPAVAIALGLVTSAIKVVHMPMGGSITLFSMLFIALIGYWYGPVTGLIGAVAYGILQFLFNGYMLSVPQVFVDYILAFGALGLSGLFWKKETNGLLYGYLLAIFGRFAFSVLSGVIFFASYAEGSGFSSPLTYSAAYNGAYIFGEAIITVVILLLPPVKNAIAKVTQMARGEQ